MTIEAKPESAEDARALNGMFRLLLAAAAANAEGPSAGFLVSLGTSIQTEPDGVRSMVTMTVPRAEFAKMAASVCEQ